MKIRTLFLGLAIFVFTLNGFARERSFTCLYSKASQTIQFKVNVNEKTLKMKITGTHSNEVMGSEGKFKVEGYARHLQGQTPPASRLVNIYELDVIHKFQFTLYPHKQFLDFHFVDVGTSGIIDCASD